MPVPCAFFFSAEFFFCALRRCRASAPMPCGCCRERGDGNSAPAAKAPEPRVRVRDKSPARKSGAGLRDRVRVGVPSRASGRGCEGRVPEQGSACRIGPSEAGAGRRFLHRGIGCSPGEGAGAPGRDSESLPEDRLRGLRFRGRVRALRTVPWTVPGVAAVSVVRGPRLIPGPGSCSADGSGGHAPEGVFRARTGVCRRPSACAESFPGRKRFPRPMSEGAEIRAPFSRAEAARGVPEVGFPGRGPAAGDFCDGRILRRRIGAIRLRP